MTHNGLSPLPQDLTLAEMSDVQIRAIVGELIKTNRDLKEVNSKLSDAQSKLIQSEKLASIGQLAAGVAHEINNPIGFIFSNFGTLEQYLEDLFQMLDAYEQAEASVSDGAALARIRSLKADLDIDYLKEDIPNLMRESRDGIQRVRKIVQDLKDFSRVDARQEWESVDLHAGIDSTLNIVNNEIKYKADVVKHYGALPEVQCLPSELNQVFMNLLVNAAHAIAERGVITVRTTSALYFSSFHTTLRVHSMPALRSASCHWAWSTREKSLRSETILRTRSSPSRDSRIRSARSVLR